MSTAKPDEERRANDLETLDVGQIARLLHLSPGWVRGLLRRGDVAGVRRGGRWLVWRDELLRSPRP